MVDSFRRCWPLVVSGGWFVGLAPTAAVAQPPATPAARTDVPGSRLAAEAYALPGEDPPHGFVPAQPRSVAEGRRIESLRFFALARAAEDRRQYREAAQLLDKALAADPQSTAVLRRLSRIQFALGHEAEAIALCRRVIATDPGDIETLALLVDNYKDDIPAAETLLKETLANPKLDRNSTGALYLSFELGTIYEATLRFGPAADAFAKVVDALDEKSNARLAPSELRRFLGNDEGQAYLRFGRVFLQARKYDLAIRAFRRGLVYNDDEALLLLYLSQAYQEAGRHEEALGTVERILKRQPRGRETYDLLAKILVTLNRQGEIVPLLEKYAALDPQNTPLQYALAEQYRAAGQVDKARAIFGRILDEQKDTQGFAEAFPRLLREHKTDELITLLTRVIEKRRRPEAIAEQIRDLADEGPYTDEILDAGFRLITRERPPFNPDDAWLMLINLASEAKRPEKLAQLLRWSLARMPNPIVYRQLILTLRELRRFDEAEAALREEMDRFRDERTPENMLELAEIQAQAEKFPEAIATVRDLLKRDPNDGKILRALAIVQNQSGKTDDALATVGDALKQEPNNPALVFLQGTILNQAGRNDEAIRLYRDLIERNANNDQLIQITRSALSTIYTGMGDYARGEAELEILFARTPDDATVNNDLGYLYADQGKNLDRAEAMIRKAVEEEPDNGAFLDSLGWVLFKRGKLDEARAPLEKATADPSNVDTTVFDHLGDVYVRLQEPGKARVAWERAVKLATRTRIPDKRLPEIRKKLQALQEIGGAPSPIRPATP